ncbi:MAG: hypothetical protein MI724_18100 [Spirochaetales bacterium]|nr:hypothetical protein [Spirochaetales bacterium]
MFDGIHPYRRRLIARFCVVAAAVGLLGACSERAASLTLPETPVLSGRGSYALVEAEYTRLFERPDRSASILSHGRRGDVLRVVGRTADLRMVEVDAPAGRGWITAEDLVLFASREQALNARHARTR